MKVHLVSPAFHGYWASIAAALEAAGHTVTTVTYDHNARLGDRVWHHLRHELPRRARVGRHRGLARAQTEVATQSVRAIRPDAVVVVKGDTLQEEFWACLDDLELPRVIWLYDEVRRTRWDLDRLARSGPVATYSPLDDANFRAAGIDSRWLPLAFDHRLVEPDERTRNDEVVFVGARYASRERILTMLSDSGVPVRAFGRDWSTHPVDRLRTWQWHRPDVPGGRDLSRRHAYLEMAAAVAALNMHGDQDGFTMRTFEASGVGGLQLVDRPDVAGLYEPGVELLTWAEDEELVELCARATRDRPWAEAIRKAGRRRTLVEHTFDHRIAVLAQSWDRPAR